MESTLQLSAQNRRYGLFRDNLHHPARKLLAAPASGNTLPSKATTSNFMGYIRDQGQEGSCTGQMKAGIRDLLYRKYFMWEKNRTIDPLLFRASAGFAYKTNLIADGDLGQDCGSSIHGSFIVMNQYGICTETVEPYSDHDFSTKPTDAQYANALLYKGGAYHFLPDIQAMKECIASGYSFGGGIAVYESFESDWNSHGFMPVPNTDKEQMLGGHAQHFMDYDDNIEFPDGSKGGFLVQNSWGSGWGISAPGRTDRGCYWMPYAFASNQELLNDTWMMHLGPAWR